MIIYIYIYTYLYIYIYIHIFLLSLTSAIVRYYLPSTWCGVSSVIFYCLVWSHELSATIGCYLLLSAFTGFWHHLLVNLVTAKILYHLRLSVSICCRELGLLVCRICFVRQSYAQSTRKKLTIVLSHENWHHRLFALQFPMKCYKLGTCGTDHLDACAYNDTFPLHPQISKWVLSGAGMHLHQCFLAAPQGIDRTETHICT